MSVRCDLSPYLAGVCRVCAFFLVLAIGMSARAEALTSGQQLRLPSDLYWPQTAAESIDLAAAKQLFIQAQAAAESGNTSQALQLATAVLQADPNHETARQVLGYERVDTQWLTAFQKKQRLRGYEWSERFGWFKPQDRPHYEAGESPQGRRWLSPELAAAEHAEINNGWQVQTDHFLVTTNHSLQAAAELGAELEKLFQVWRQLFAGYYLGDAEVRARFAGQRKARKRSKPLRVFYHRDKAGYVRTLISRQPRIAETNGIYFDREREAHFFANNSSSEFALEPSQRATLYHEAVHQLFQEMGAGRSRSVGDEANFWVVEGVACYFESLMPAEEGESLQIGTATGGRLPAARHRALIDQYYVPLAELAGFGKSDLQRREDLPRLYSQMAGLATFFMHANDANVNLREAFVSYLRTVYSGRDRDTALSQATGLEFAELDRQYRQYLQTLP